jgi:hypothetical protein
LPAVLGVQELSLNIYTAFERKWTAFGGMLGYSFALFAPQLE